MPFAARAPVTYCCFGVKADTGESRSYRLDRVNAATVTRQAFRPRYVVELTASGPVAAPTLQRGFHRQLPLRRLDRSLVRVQRLRAAPDPSPSGKAGLSYTFACTVCSKTFKRSTYDATLNPHKNKQGWPCLGPHWHPCDESEPPWYRGGPLV